MKIKSGILELTKTDVKQFRELINHTLSDISYGTRGSYGDGDTLYESESKLSLKAIENLEWIIDRSQ